MHNLEKHTDDVIGQSHIHSWCGDKTSIWTRSIKDIIQSGSVIQWICNPTNAREKESECLVDKVGSWHATPTLSLVCLISYISRACSMTYPTQLALKPARTYLYLPRRPVGVIYLREMADHRPTSVNRLLTRAGNARACVRGGMSARRFFNSIIKKTSRSGKSSSSMKKANASTTEDDTYEDKELVDPRRTGIPLSESKSPGGRRAVSAIALDISDKRESHAAARRVQSMPRPRAGKGGAATSQKPDSSTTGYDDDSSPDVVPKRRIKPRKSLPPGAPQARIRQERDPQDDYTDPEDATGDSELLEQENANAVDDEYTEPWQRDGVRAKKVVNRVKSPTPENVAHRPHSTHDEPWVQKRKPVVSVKTEAQPTSSVSTGMNDVSASSDYADPWDRLPRLAHPQRVKSSTKSPVPRRRKAEQATTADQDQDDYDQPWDTKRLNDQGVVVGDRKCQPKSSDDYDDPWDTHTTNPPITSSKPPKPRPKPKPRSVASDDYDDPWDKKSSPSPRPPPPTRAIPPRPMDRSVSPEVEKPKLNERPGRRMERRAPDDNPGPVPAIIDTGMPLAKQT